MGAAYQILGKSVKPHQLALATLGSVVLLVLPKPWGPEKPKSPSINAGSEDEDKFVKEWLAKNTPKSEHH